MRCMRCKCRMEPLHLSALPWKAPSIIIILSEWIPSVLLDVLVVNEYCSIALTGEPYSNIPPGAWWIRWSRLGKGEWEAELPLLNDLRCYSTVVSLGIHLFKEEHLKSQSPLLPALFIADFTSPPHTKKNQKKNFSSSFLISSSHFVALWNCSIKMNRVFGCSKPIPLHF